MARILVAEDYPGIRLLLTEEINLLGHEVIDAVDGIDALKKAKESNGTLDLVVTDYGMPGYNGMQLLTKLREAGVLAPVILHCAQDEELMNRCRSAGFAAVIGKGTDCSELLQLVRAMLAN